MMKNGMKLFAAGAAIAAVGMIAYRKYRDSYELISEEAQQEENDFEPMVEVDDGFDYYIDDIDQIMFHE